MTRCEVMCVGVCGVLMSVSGSAFGVDSIEGAREVSADGRVVVRVGAEGVVDRETAMGSGSGGGVFGVESDVEIDLRRQVSAVEVADVNGDGFNDLVVVCYNSNSFPPYEDWRDMIFYGSASGIETSPSWISTEQTHSGDVEVGDVDGDGRLDVVTVHGGIRSDNVSVHFGQADGSVGVSAGWVSGTSPSVWGTSGVLVDMDDDGDLDLVTTNQGVGQNSPTRPMFLFRNDGTGFESDPSWESSAYEISNGIDARDINGDGYPELAVAKWVNFKSAIYMNTTGTPETMPSIEVSGTDAEKGAGFTDLDGDGVFEVAFGGSPTSVFSVDGSVLTPVGVTNPPFSGPQEIEFADVDGDGDDDLLEVHFSDGRAHVYLNNEGTLATDPSWTYDASPVGTAITAGDLNNDGAMDLVVGYSGEPCIRVFYGEVASCPADLNGDGNLNFLDVSAFLSFFGAQDPRADFQADGMFNFLDVSGFLAAFGEGCP